VNTTGLFSRRRNRVKIIRWLVRFSRKDPDAFVIYDVLQPGDKRPGVLY